MSPEAAAAAVEAVVREAYGRLLAFVASQTSDISAAEDALADALEAALRTWPHKGVPARPESWMLTVARRSLIGGGRRRAVAERHALALAMLTAERAERAERGPGSAVPDKRLELLFICAHPALPRSLHAPLMLQTLRSCGTPKPVVPPVETAPAGSCRSAGRTRPPGRSRRSTGVTAISEPQPPDTDPGRGRCKR